AFTLRADRRSCLGLACSPARDRRVRARELATVALLSVGLDARGVRVIVTGASRGLGAAIAATLRARGDEVIGASRRGGEGVLVADVGADAGRRAIVAAASDGPVDALVQAAGVIRYEGVGAIDEG